MRRMTKNNVIYKILNLHHFLDSGEREPLNYLCAYHVFFPSSSHLLISLPFYCKFLSRCIACLMFNFREGWVEK
jgi:hypothetical protein